ncbi:MAG: Uma2 family endonuclease, partial [Nitrospinota bacterium]
MREAKTLLTADQLFHLPDDGFCYELVKGELRRMPPAGGEHGAIVMRLSLLLGRFIQDNALGVALGAETGFLIGTDPDTVRAPDFAFVRRDRVPEDGIPEGFWPGPPDLAVEVISPTDTYAAIEE